VATLEQQDLVAGALALDFANTVAGDREGAAQDCLASVRDLVAWARLAGILDSDQERRLQDVAAGDPRAAADAFDRAIALREAIYAAFSGVARDGAPPPGAVATIAAALAEQLPRARLQPADGRLAWTFPQGDATEALLGPIAASAFELLATPSPARIRRCDGETCGWLFYDSSKAGRRRWCEMTRGCGNRAKARRHRDRRRRTGGNAGTMPA
jgi:predicted RNA-binding Zn ribbon-like protein